MTNETILRTAMEQSAIDAGCSPEDFLRSEPVIVTSAVSPNARRYLKLPLTCNLISYGHNVVASIDEQYREIVTDYLHRYTFVHCFETPNLHVLDDAFRPHGFRSCFMAEYFLPDTDRLTRLDCGYRLRVLEKGELDELHSDTAWSNALSSRRPELDVLGVGAYDGGRLVGLAGCSADCDTMYQIGIDVKPNFRRQGIASALTSRLALEILDRGKVPFYCAAWSNLPSVRNALRCGFRPAWVELTVKPASFVDEMNR